MRANRRAVAPAQAPTGRPARGCYSEVFSLAAPRPRGLTREGRARGLRGSRAPPGLRGQRPGRPLAARPPPLPRRAPPAARAAIRPVLRPPPTADARLRTRGQEAGDDSGCRRGTGISGSRGVS